MGRGIWPDPTAGLGRRVVATESHRHASQSESEAQWSDGAMAAMFGSQAPSPPSHMMALPPMSRQCPKLNVAESTLTEPDRP